MREIDSELERLDNDPKILIMEDDVWPTTNDGVTFAQSLEKY